MFLLNTRRLNNEKRVVKKCMNKTGVVDMQLTKKVI